MKCSLSLRRIFTSLALLALAVSTRAQTIPNPSFETDTFTVFPGYVSGNGLISGWTGSANNRVGLNPAGGSPFADNGVIPAGNNVAFIQSDGAIPAGVTLSTTISGLTVGQPYKVNFRVNARDNQQPNLKVEIDGTRIINTAIGSVQASNPYRYFAFDFTAAAASQTLTLRNDVAGDSTVVIDDFNIAPRNSGWSYTAWHDDSDANVDGTKHFTHAYNFGSAANATINGVLFTGVAGGNPAVPGSFSTTGMPNVIPGDANNVTGGSRTLANTFIYGNAGRSTPNVVQTLTLNGLTPGAEYVAIIYSVAWETGTRAATFSVGGDLLTVNQDHFDNDNGLRVSYHYIATSSSITLTYMPLQDATFHTYGFCNFEPNAPTPPSISQQPAGQCVQSGQNATFTVNAVGSLPLSYQWQKDGVDISGANSSSFTIFSTITADMGFYSVVVTNLYGTNVSASALLEVGINTVANPSFEADTFTVFPGYVSGNGPITGWNALGGHGVNSSAGPFADNGTIPAGNNVAFMQQDGALSQIIGGFEIGADYYVAYFENARSGGVPGMEVKIGDTTIVAPHLRSPVGGANPYVKITSDMFTATDNGLQLSFIKSNPQGGDTTALIDNVCVVELLPGTPPRITDQPGSQIAFVGGSVSFSVHAVGSLPLNYQWQKDGAPIGGATGPTFTINPVSKSDEGLYSVVVDNGNGTPALSGDAQLTVDEPIPGLYNTGVDSTRTVLPDGSVDSHYLLVTNADSTSTDAIVENSGAFPIVTGPWLANTANSKWIGPRFDTTGAAGGRYVYRVTIDLTDRDLSTVLIQGRWAVDNTGADILVNGTSTGNPASPGFDSYTPFSITSANASFVAGLNTIDFVTDNGGVGWCGLRVDLLRNNAHIPAGVAPRIISQPVNRKAVEGDSVTFEVTASGSLPFTYKWKKDGVELPGQTASRLTLLNLLQSDVGRYSVVVGNDAGSVESDPALLCIPWRRISGVVFGTGVDDTGGLLPTGATDPHYILAGSVDPDFQGPDAFVVDDSQFPIPPWILSGPKSKWIAPQTVQTNGNAAGDYTYETFFDLTGYDLTQVRVVGQWAVDNTGSDILVNGVSTGVSSPGFGGFTPFLINSGLNAGPNQLDFKMNNAGTDVNPTGLRVDLELQQTIQPTITRIGDIFTSGSDVGIRVYWTPTSPCQTLYSADDVTGPWTPLTGVQSGDGIIIGSATTKFFKIIEQ